MMDRLNNTQRNRHNKHSNNNNNDNNVKSNNKKGLEIRNELYIVRFEF